MSIRMLSEREQLWLLSVVCGTCWGTAAGMVIRFG